MAKTKTTGQQPASSVAPTAKDTVDHSQPEDLLEGSASGLPDTRADRLAFSLWVVMFMLLIGFTLVTYLVNRFTRS